MSGGRPAGPLLALLGFGIFLAPSTRAAAPPVSPPTSHECSGVPNCVSVPGPWVIVHAYGITDYVLTCPQQGSFAGGVDSLATSRDVRVTFEGLMGSPVAAGRTTGSAILFEAMSATHKVGAFRPSIGCVPVSAKSPQTVSFSRGSGADVTPIRVILAAPTATPAIVTPAGPPVTFAVRTLALRPGRVETRTLGCGPDQGLVDGWYATAFGGSTPPDLSLAEQIHVQLTPRHDTVSVAVATGETLTVDSKPQIQLGVRCTQR